MHSVHEKGGSPPPFNRGVMEGRAKKTDLGPGPLRAQRENQLGAQDKGPLGVQWNPKGRQGVEPQGPTREARRPTNPMEGSGGEPQDPTQNAKEP